jgi:hypothetical protein
MPFPVNCVLAFARIGMIDFGGDWGFGLSTNITKSTAASTPQPVRGNGNRFKILRCLYLIHYKSQVFKIEKNIILLLKLLFKFLFLIRL